MSVSRDRRRGLLGVIGPLILAVVGCTTGAPAQTSVPSVATPSPSDAFAGLTYRLTLPADWIVLGSSSYDASLDAVPDVAAWLERLGLVGANAFRAYEPLRGATGVRLAINPRSPWGPTTLEDSAAIAAFPGVTDEPIGEYVAVGEMAKGARFRWTQSIDWGSGSPSARTCVGYSVMGEFDPVYVVFSYPAETNRLADVEAVIASLEVLGNPAVSLPPGATPSPSPTPYDKYGSPAPMPTYHGDLTLEALLPDRVDGVALTKESRTGDQTGLWDDYPMLKTFGKHPADFATATASSTEPPMLTVWVARLRGVPADQLQAAMLEMMPGVKVSSASLAGRQLTYVEEGAWPVWFYATGDLVFQIVADEATVAKVVALLP